MNKIMSNNPFRRFAGLFNEKVVFPIMDILDTAAINQHNQTIMKEKGWSKPDLELVHDVLGRVTTRILAEGPEGAEDLDARYRELIASVIKDDPELVDKLETAEITMDDIIDVRDKPVGQEPQELIQHAL